MQIFFPRGVLDEILNLIQSVSEDFPSYFSFMLFKLNCSDCPCGTGKDNSCNSISREHFVHLVMYKTIFVINIILHMCLQHSNTL